MKKIYSILLAALAVCAVSCQEGPLEKPETEVPETGETMTFTASLTPGTKVSLGQPNEKGEIPACWEKGDKIRIYTESEPYNDHSKFGTEFSTQNSGTGNATFTGKTITRKTDGKYYAVYGKQIPGNDSNINTNLYEGTVHHVVIPGDQKITGEQVRDSEASLLLAVSDDTNLHFENATALLSFTVQAENVKLVEIEAPQGVILSGEGSVQMTETGPVLHIYKDASNVVRMRGNFVNGSTYYIAVTPTEKNAIVSLKMYVNGHTYKDVKFNNPQTFIRSQIINLGSIKGQYDSMKFNVTLSDFKYNDNNKYINGLYLNGSKYQGIETNGKMLWNVEVPAQLFDNLKVKFVKYDNEDQWSNEKTVPFRSQMNFMVNSNEWSWWQGWNPILF